MKYPPFAIICIITVLIIRGGGSLQNIKQIKKNKYGHPIPRLSCIFIIMFPLTSRTLLNIIFYLIIELVRVCITLYDTSARFDFL